MVDDVLPLDGLPQGGAVVQVARDDPDAERREGRGLAGRPRQRGHLIAPAAKGFGEVTADEARRPSDQHLHIGRS